MRGWGGRVVVWLCGCVAHEDAGGMRCGVVCGVVRCGSVTVLSSVGGAGVCGACGYCVVLCVLCGVEQRHMGATFVMMCG